MMSSPGQNVLKFRHHDMLSYCRAKYSKIIQELADASKAYPKCQVKFIHLTTNQLSQHEDTNQQRGETGQTDHIRHAYEKKRANRQNETVKTNISVDMNHYQRLNVDENADTNSIKSAYYALSKRYHPDIVGSSDKATVETFRLITESYDVLSNADSRADYDGQLNKTDLMDVVKKSKFPERNINPLYMTRDADMIFRQRQNSLLQKEKLSNPRKFQAGSFDRSHPRVNFNDGIAHFREMDDFRSVLLDNPRKVHSSNCNDGSDFYRIHLASTLERTRFENREHDRLSSDKSEAKEGLLLGLFLVGALLIAFLGTLDLPGYLDRRLFNEKGQQQSGQNDDG